MKKRKRLIILTSLISVVLLIVILSSTLFTLKTVDVEFRTANNKYLNETQIDQIVSSGQFPMKKNIFFANLDKSINLIEKNNPYVKVINIERKFPSSATINIVERAPAVKVYKSANQCYILDEELKILNIVNNENGYLVCTGEDQVPTFDLSAYEGLTLDLSGEAGDFLSNNTFKSYVSAFYRGAYGYQGVGTSIFEKITLKYEAATDVIYFNVTFRESDVTAVVQLPENLEDSVYKVVSVYMTKGTEYSSITAYRDGKVLGVRK